MYRSVVEKVYFQLNFYTTCVAHTCTHVKFKLTDVPFLKGTLTVYHTHDHTTCIIPGTCEASCSVQCNGF